MTAGIVESWSFGREFVDDGLPALFPRSRHRAGWAQGAQPPPKRYQRSSCCYRSRLPRWPSCDA